MAKRKPPSRQPQARLRRRRRGHPQAPGRTGEAALWLFGLHAVAAALANPKRRALRLLATPDAAARLAESWRRPGGAPARADLAWETAERSAIERVVPPGAVHQGVALLAQPLAPVELNAVAVGVPIVVLDQVSDPRNLGAVLRSAAAFGAAAVIVPERNAPPESGTLAKAASGALEMVPLVRVVNLARAIELLQDAGYWCVGLDAEARQPLSAARLEGACALVLGSEGGGLRRLTRERCDELARVPIKAGIDSLNLSAAAAVALYEMARRREGRP